MPPPPPKLKPPADGDRHRGADIIVTYFVFSGIAAALVCLRLYVRSRIIKKVGWDDWLILFAMLVAIVGLGFNCAMVNEGFGRHQFYLLREPLNFLEGIKWQVFWQPTFIVSVILTRISICCFLLGIFNVNPVWRYGLYGMIVFILITNIPGFVIVFIQCRPFEKSWNALLPGECWEPQIGQKIGLYNGIISVIIDWVLATLPIAFLWDMQLSLKAKIGVCALMGMGFFSGVSAVVRTVIFVRVTSAGKTADFTWSTIDLRVWGTLENQLGIIAACIPCVKPLYVAAASFVSSRSRSSRGYIEHNGQRPHQLRRIGKPKDPYSTTIIDATTASSAGRQQGFFEDGPTYPDAERYCMQVETDRNQDRYGNDVPLKAFDRRLPPDI